MVVVMDDIYSDHWLSDVVRQRKLVVDHLRDFDWGQLLRRLEVRADLQLRRELDEVFLWLLLNVL